MKDAFVEASATVEDGARVGAATSVWHHAHVRTGATIGSECIIGDGVYVGAGVAVGDRCKIQNHAALFEGSRLGDGVFVGPAAVLANDRYPRAVNPDGRLKSANDWARGTVEVAEGASIGAGAVVVPDVTIGRWAMIGAGSVVTRDVAAHELVVGNPIRHIGYACVCGRRLAQSGGVWQCTCGRSFTLPEATS